VATEKRLVDANKLPYSIAVDDNGKQIFYVKAEDIDKAPTVDAVEVVRCKDCRWYNLELGICNLHSESKGEPDVGYVVGMDPDDFCSYGERRTDETH
jgi:hypothetical protein